MTDYRSGAVGATFDFTKATYIEEGRQVDVASTLIFGIQWDATMQFFDSNYINGVCAANSYVVRANGKGYEAGDCVNTGYYSMKNIYDMAGNVREWTMEAS